LGEEQDEWCLVKRFLVNQRVELCSKPRAKDPPLTDEFASGTPEQARGVTQVLAVDLADEVVDDKAELRGNGRIRPDAGGAEAEDRAILKVVLAMPPDGARDVEPERIGQGQGGIWGREVALFIPLEYAEKARIDEDGDAEMIFVIDDSDDIGLQDSAQGRVGTRAGERCIGRKLGRQAGL
jgi:hypothetical protein